MGLTRATGLLLIVSGFALLYILEQTPFILDWIATQLDWHIRTTRRLVYGFGMGGLVVGLGLLLLNAKRRRRQ